MIIMKNIDDERYLLLGYNIAYFRKLSKLTQMQLAKKIGISRTHLSRIEIGECVPSLSLVFDIADALYLPVKELFDFYRK